MDGKKGRNTWRWGTIRQIRQKEQLKVNRVSRVSRNRCKEGDREKGRNQGRGEGYGTGQKWRESRWRRTHKP